MNQRFTPEQIAKQFCVVKATVIAWCESGLMPAVNVATASAKRKRWRISQDDVQIFIDHRSNRYLREAKTDVRRTRSFPKPTKDYLSDIPSKKGR